MYELSIKQVFDEYEKRSKMLERDQGDLDDLEAKYDKAVSLFKDAKASIHHRIEQRHEELCELKDAMELLGSVASAQDSDD